MPIPRQPCRAGRDQTSPPGSTRPSGRRAAACVRACLLSAVLAAAGAGSAVAQVADDEWQLGTFPSFSSGRYGGDTSTEVLHTAVTARRLFDDGDITVVLPHTCVWGDSGVTVVNGIPVRTERLVQAETGDARLGRLEADATSTTARARTSACGLGDIVVRGRYYVVDGGGRRPTVALQAHVKAPTASADHGLGTGRFDEGIAVEVSQGLGRSTLLMADGGYTLIGDPQGVELDDNWWYDIGVGQDLAGGVVNVSLFFEQYRALVPGLPGARDVLAALTLRATGGWQVQAAALAGLSHGAPDRGFTLGASRRF